MTSRTLRRCARGEIARLTLAIAFACALLCPGAAFAADLVDGVTAQTLGVPSDALPDVAMKSGILTNESGRVLWERNADDERAMASLTKIMTAVVALEQGRPTDELRVPQGVRGVGESTSFLVPGDRLTLHEALEALLVKSGNDAAFAIADHVAGSQDAFVALMNAKARALGLSHTRFANAHGLDAKGHHTTARDLAVLSRYAMSIPAIRSIVSEKKAVIVKSTGSTKIENTDLLLVMYPGADGIKTGYTGDAGYCVSTSAERNGVRLYAVVLGTKSPLARFTQAKALLDWGFAHYRPQQLGSKGTVIGMAQVSDYLDTAVPAAISTDVVCPAFDVAGPIRRVVVAGPVRAPVEVGQRVGAVRYVQRGRVLISVPLVATQKVKAPNIFQRIGIAVARAWRRVFASRDDPAPTKLTSERAFRSRSEGLRRTHVRRSA